MSPCPSQRDAAIGWYLTPKPIERCEPAEISIAKETCAARICEELKPSLALPNDVLELGLEALPLEDLQKLAECAKDALSRRVPLGREYKWVAPTPAPAPEWATPTVMATPSTLQAVIEEPASEPVALHPKKWVDFPLCEREEINHNTRRLRFALPCPNLGLPVGMHIFLRSKEKIKNAEGDEKLCMRAYTPVGSGPGYVEFIIKVYFANEHPRFPAGGILTQYMERMKIGDCLAFKGPLGEFAFDAATPVMPVPRDTPLSFQINGGAPTSYRHLGLIAGGSGITPCLQVANAILQLDREISISLVYANQSPADILCADMIAAIEKDPRVRVWYTVDRPPADGEWKYGVGFIDEAMCRDKLPAPSDDTYVFMCGPPPMIKFACRPNLEKLGHEESRLLCF